MNETVREIVIQGLVARAAEITQDNGYATDIGANVFRARKNLDPSDLPAVVIFPGIEEAAHQYGGLSCTMPVRIEGVMLFEGENPSVVSEKILGDLKKCFLGDDWSRSPDYVDKIVYTRGGTDDYPEEGQVSVGAMIQIDVGYASRLDDPTQQ